MNATNQLIPVLGVKDACEALALPRANYYRWRQPAREKRSIPQRRPPFALSEQERQTVLQHLDSAEFVDMAPHEVYASLLDRGTYLCSIRTMYRILAEEGQVKERRNQLRRPKYRRPELLATRPNQLWTWDITKLKGPTIWTYFYLYVIIDVFSRYIPGWLLAFNESADLATRLIAETSRKQGIVPHQLIIHADNGSSMTSKSVGRLLTDLGIVRSHSRPYRSNDNPFSESHFKTLKYRPYFPRRFGSIEETRLFCREFFDWYNKCHYHTGIALLHPEDVHYDRGQQILDYRNQVRHQAFLDKPDRFGNKSPKPFKLQPAVWINPPFNNRN